MKKESPRCKSFLIRSFWVTDVWAKILSVLILMGGIIFLCFEKILDYTSLESSPCYVFLRSANANMRSGPHKEYPCIRSYRRKYLPMKVLKEHEEWLLVEDMYGSEGWIHRSLCSRRQRYVITTKTTHLYSERSERSKLLAVIDPSVCLLYKRARLSWRRVYVRHEGVLLRGWVAQDTVWGG